MTSRDSFPPQMIVNRSRCKSRDHAVWCVCVCGNAGACTCARVRVGPLTRASMVRCVRAVHACVVCPLVWSTTMVRYMPISNQERCGGGSSVVGGGGGGDVGNGDRRLRWWWRWCGGGSLATFVTAAAAAPPACLPACLPARLVRSVSL